MELTLKDHIYGYSNFMYYRDKTLYYETRTQVLFGIPIDDLGTASLQHTEKSIHLMRWIRKHLEMVATEKSNNSSPGDYSHV